MMDLKSDPGVAEKEKQAIKEASEQYQLRIESEERWLASKLSPLEERAVELCKRLGFPVESSWYPIGGICQVVLRPPEDWSWEQKKELSERVDEVVMQLVEEFGAAAERHLEIMPSTLGEWASAPLYRHLG